MNEWMNGPRSGLLNFCEFLKKLPVTLRKYITIFRKHMKQNSQSVCECGGMLWVEPDRSVNDLALTVSWTRSVCEWVCTFCKMYPIGLWVNDIAGVTVPPKLTPRILGHFLRFRLPPSGKKFLALAGAGKKLAASPVLWFTPRQDF